MKEYLGHQATLKTIRTLAGNVGMSLVIQGTAQPCTDGRKIILPDPNLDSTVGYDVWLGFAYHEIRHNWPEFRGCFEFLKEKKINMKSLLGGILNALEDFQIESYKHDMYLGEKHAISKAHEHICTHKNIPGFKKRKGQFEKPDAAFAAVLIWLYRHRPKFQPNLFGMADKMQEAASNKQIDEYVSMLESGAYIHRIYPGLISMEEVYLLALDIVELFDIPKSESESVPETETETEVPASGKVLWEDLQFHNHDPEGPSYSSMEIDYTNWQEDSYSSKLNDQLVEKPKAGKNTNYVPAVESNSLSQQVLKLLEIQSRSRNIHGQKSGKISPKSLYRSQVKDSGSYQTKLFRQKQTRYTLDTAVTVLCDLSGSMGGSKYIHAAHSAILLNRALGPLGIPLEILGFTTHGGGLRHVIFKESLERIDDESLRLGFCAAASWMSNNADGDSIMWAYSRLSGAKNSRKVLMVLSDGYPAASGGDIYGHTKKVIEAIESSNVEIYGLGIQSEAVKELYRNYGVVDNLDSLESVILNTIKTQILN